MSIYYQKKIIFFSLLSGSCNEYRESTVKSRFKTPEFFHQPPLYFFFPPPRAFAFDSKRQNRLLLIHAARSFRSAGLHADTRQTARRSADIWTKRAVRGRVA